MVAQAGRAHHGADGLDVAATLANYLAHVGIAHLEPHDGCAAARLGVNLTDFRCLDLLSQGKPITAGELATQSGLTTGSVTALIDRLERSGYVRRGRDPQDRRRVVILPTRLAAETVWPLFQSIVETASAVLSRFTVSELQTILRFLETNRTAIREQLKNLGGKPRRRPAKS